LNGALAREIANDIHRSRPDLPPITGAFVAGIDADPSAKTTIIFLNDSGAAVGVAKIARDHHAERDVGREHDALRRVLARGAMASSIPEPLDLTRIDGRLTLVTSALNGEPMMTRYYAKGHTDDRTEVESDFRAAFDWLLDLQARTGAMRVPLDEAFDRYAGDVLPRYRAQIGWSVEEEAIFAAAEARARSLSDLDVPLCVSHGDYWMGNILMRDNRVVGVIDWERADDRAVPFRDLYKFPTSYGFYLDRTSRARRSSHPGREALRERWQAYGSWPNLIGFAYTFFGRGWFPDLARASILGHLRALGLPPAVNSAFFPLFLAEQAMVLPDPAFRRGYRAALRGSWGERDSTWLWSDSGGRAEGEQARAPFGEPIPGPGR
jgi:aminoglycoside phosphotransferase